MKTGILMLVKVPPSPHPLPDFQRFRKSERKVALAHQASFRSGERRGSSHIVAVTQTRFYRNNKHIGDHVFSFKRNENLLEVESEINFKIKKLGVVLYKYHVKGVEYYKDGKLNSKWKVWHGNGKLAEEGEYKVGEKIGEWIYYKKDGFIDKVKTY